MQPATCDLAVAKVIDDILHRLKNGAISAGRLEDLKRDLIRKHSAKESGLDATGSAKEDIEKRVEDALRHSPRFCAQRGLKTDYFGLTGKELDPEEKTDVQMYVEVKYNLAYALSQWYVNERKDLRLALFQKMVYTRLERKGIDESRRKKLVKSFRKDLQHLQIIDEKHDRYRPGRILLKAGYAVREGYAITH